jgi:hypothetical protein
MPTLKQIGTEKINLPGSEIDGRELPTFIITERHLLPMEDHGERGKWSNPKPPPDIATRVNVNFNGFGLGTVVDYFIEGGWLGLEVEIDKQPDWHRKQNGPQKVIRVFGLEVDY